MSVQSSEGYNNAGNRLKNALLRLASSGPMSKLIIDIFVVLVREGLDVW